MPRRVCNRVLSFFLLVGVGFLTAAAPAPADLTGVWRLLAEEGEGDPLRKQLEEALVVVDHSEAREIVTPDGRRAVVGIKRLRPPPEEVERLADSVDRISPLVPLERIEAAGDALELVYRDGRRRRICPGCGQGEDTVLALSDRQVRSLMLAGWEEDGRLVIESNSNVGIRVLEQLHLEEDGARLVVERIIRSPRFGRPLRVVEVYVREPSSPAS
ncbi:MAG: hypothetical protein KatS3mg121_0505 [Gammaproteobacteria bacterium]|nr:MAG: hypothetical protein KatS3mg121_0505 [Gammaproteobacteria bacterium]